MLAIQHGYYSTDFNEVYLMENAVEIYNDFMATKCIYPIMKDTQTDEELEIFKKECEKCVHKWNEQLGEHGKAYMAGDRITIGDFATFAWITSFSHNPVQKNKLW